MKTLLDYNLEQLERIIVGLNEPKFRAKQLFESLNLGKSLSEITTLPKTTIEALQKEYADETVSLIKEQKSADGTVKFLFKLHDDNAIESVLMSYKHGYSVCVSSQVGCRMKCEFCASGVNGIVRSLSPGEMLAQVAYINKYLGGKLKENRKITNIVLMGTGEPLDNYDNVIKFLKLVNDANGLNISFRNISLSTCGIVPQIKKLADEGMPLVLTISLHAGSNETRGRIMPIAKKYSIESIFEACWYYFNKIGRRIVFEYILIKNVTATNSELKNLIKLFKGTPFHLNLIMLNEVEGKSLQKITLDEARAFEAELDRAHISVTLRRTLGDDIDAACG
ncbi:MAG: 23S rRNA (adenine(2503)-C(2))-methyltransferase RlmN, partial [Clostridia bacterium]|nr:23S rRNA (adenine(2503)-C(2))-methyltransferase RlmN [Clostridia bacterium]